MLNLTLNDTPLIIVYCWLVVALLPWTHWPDPQYLAVAGPWCAARCLWIAPGSDWVGT